MLIWKQTANEGDHFGLKTHAVDRRGSKGKNSFEYIFFIFENGFSHISILTIEGYAFRGR